MKIKSALVLMALSLGSLAASQGGEFWQKKAYRQWSEKECRKLLEDSPWAKSYTLTQILIEPLQTNSTERAREARPQINYQAQFRSALPVRQAVVRLSQINAKYDEMQPEQKQAFDQKGEEFVAKRFPDRVVLHVAYSSNVQADDRELARLWRSQTTETLQNFVFLILPRGEKVPLSGYAVTQGAGREFQFEFPRAHKGHPLIGREDKTLQLEFPHPSIRGQAESRVLISFKIDKMMIEEAVVY